MEVHARCCGCRRRCWIWDDHSFPLNEVRRESNEREREEGVNANRKERGREKVKRKKRERKRDKSSEGRNEWLKMRQRKVAQRAYGNTNECSNFLVSCLFRSLNRRREKCTSENTRTRERKMGKGNREQGKGKERENRAYRNRAWE